MDKIQLAACNNVHFIGIGGISMSGLAEILHRKGKRVSGSDTKATDITKHLQLLGIEVSIGQTERNIKNDFDLVVYTAAVKDDNPELVAARSINALVIDRAELLGMMMSNYRYPICVSGTHGKTTTTSMIGDIFMAANADPTITVGGVMPSIDSNFRMGGDNYFIAESCEYFDSFLKFYPYIGVILNVDLDHLDYFKDIQQMVSSFTRFAQNISANGALIINGEIPYLDKITAGLSCRIITYGTTGSNFCASEISYDKNGYGQFDLVHNGHNAGRFELKVPGEHNMSNALAAIAAAVTLDIGMDDIRCGLGRFIGAKRRFEIKGRLNGALVVDDYAHHPTEIKATLAAARKMKSRSGNQEDGGRTWCVFQPHTFSRTRDLLKELSESFDEADKVIIMDIYAAREKDMGDIHATHLQQNIQKRGKECFHFSDFESVEKFLSKECIPNDLLITMGAGDVYLIGDDLLKP